MTMTRFQVVAIAAALLLAVSTELGGEAEVLKEEGREIEGASDQVQRFSDAPAEQRPVDV